MRGTSYDIFRCDQKIVCTLLINSYSYLASKKNVGIFKLLGGEFPLQIQWVKKRTMQFEVAVRVKLNLETLFAAFRGVTIRVRVSGLTFDTLLWLWLGLG